MSQHGEDALDDPDSLIPLLDVDIETECEWCGEPMTVGRGGRLVYACSCWEGGH